MCQNTSAVAYNHYLAFHKSILYVQSAKTDMKLQYLKETTHHEISGDKLILQKF